MTTVLQSFGGNPIYGLSDSSLMRIDSRQSCSNQSRSKGWMLIDRVKSGASTDEENMDPPWGKLVSTTANQKCNGSHVAETKSAIVRRKSSSSIDFLQTRERLQPRYESKPVNGHEEHLSNIPTYSRKPVSVDNVERPLPDPGTNGSPVKQVGSLTSSPKWSRIKRTFERQNSAEDLRLTDPLQKTFSSSSNSLVIPKRCFAEGSFVSEKEQLMKSNSLPSCELVELHYTQNSTFVQQAFLKQTNFVKDHKIATENTNSSVVKPSSLVTRSHSFRQSSIKDVPFIRHETDERSIVSAKQQASNLFKNKLAARLEQVKNKTSLNIETGNNLGSNADKTQRLYLERECETLIKNTSSSMVQSAFSLGLKATRHTNFNTNIPVAKQISSQRENLCKSIQPKYTNSSSLPQIRIDESLHSSKSGWKQMSSGAWVKVNDNVREINVPCSKTSKVALLAQKFNSLTSSVEEKDNVVVENENTSKPITVRNSNKPKNYQMLQSDDICTSSLNARSDRSKSYRMLQNGDVFSASSDKRNSYILQNGDTSSLNSMSDSEQERISCNGAVEKRFLRKISCPVVVCEQDTIATDTIQSKSGRKFSLVQQVVQNFEEHCQLNISDNELVIQFEKESRSSKETWCSLQPSVAKKGNNNLNKFRQSSESPKPAVPDKKSSIRDQYKRSPSSGRKPTLPPCIFAKRRQGIISDGGEELANQIAEDDLISSMEDWLEEKCHVTSERNTSVKPNQSFLWRQRRPQTSNESADNEPDGYYSVPFQHLQKFEQEEHIYMDATLLRNCPASQRKPTSRDGSSCESDEGWVDMSDAEIDRSCSDLHKSSNYMGVQLRPRSRILKSDSSRRSWCQSLRDLASAVDTDTEDWESNDYQDISVWESGDTSSSSTNSDHIYEALYDVILEDREQDLDEGDETESCSRPDSGDTGIDSGPPSTPSTHMSEDRDEATGEEIKIDNAKTDGLKRNWSLTKSDIRLELSSKLNKIKIRKNFRSATDLGVQVQQPASPLPESKKKTLIKFILRQKSTAAPAVPKKRNKKGATFYVRWSVMDKNTRGRSQSESALVDATKHEGSFIHRQMSEGSSRSSLQEEPKQVATVKRRPSGASAIKRPKSPPPLPPVGANVTRKRSGAKSLELVVSKNALSRMDSSKSRSLDVDRVSDFDFHERKQPFNNLGNSKLSLHSTPSNVSLSLPNSRMSVASKSSAGSYIHEDEVASIPKPNSLFLSVEREDDEISYLQLQTDLQETLKSPFEEEPLYQFYQKHVSQQATMWHTMNDADARSDTSETNSIQDYEDHTPQKFHPTAMDLLHHSRAGQRTLWCEVPEVIKSGLLEKVSPQDRKLQEAMFEVITSEASYLKSLNVLVEHFMKRPEFNDDFSVNCVLERRERHVLFSDVLPVRDVSVRLLADLEKRWQENILLSNICDILYEHSTKFFSVYVRYCSNQVYQERKIKELKTTRSDFVDVLQRVEANPVCQGLDMHSFLMLPMQRITRLPLLVDAIFHRLPVDSPHYDICKLTLTQLNKVVWECNEGARKMERMEEMLLISRQLDFKDSKSIALISASRWLVKRGELTKVSFDVFAKRTFGRSGKCSKSAVYLFLFTDLLLVAKKKSEESYTVLDYCPRNMVQVFSIEDSGLPLPVKMPDNSKNLFQLTMLQNSEAKTVEMILSCPLESDRTRWMEAVTPPKSENPDEKIYEEWDCPQVQCIFSYTAQQPDELSLDESDVVNVFRKMSDGWFEGERLRDGIRGWFPASYTVEIISSHIRARNLRQRYRLLVLSHAYLEEQRKACLTQSAKTK